MSRNDGEFETAFARTLGGLLHQARISQMAGFRQHGSATTLEHAVRVAKASLRLARALRIPVNETELVRGAVLHDYCLYDWHEPGHAGHATKHPLHARKNAEHDFELTAKERNIIASHMWPIPPTRVPLSREAWLVCVADKWCTLAEVGFICR